MTHDPENPPPCIVERYTAAAGSSNLRVQADRSGPADVLIAAAWSASSIGTALMRLHSKPDRATLEQVQQQVAMHAQKLRIERPDAVAASTIAWWLSRTCKVCSGRRYEVIPDTPALSNTQCRACGGTGEAKLPYGSDGRALVEWMNRCKSIAVEHIKQRLRPTPRKNIAHKT